MDSELLAAIVALLGTIVAGVLSACISIYVTHKQSKDQKLALDKQLAAQQEEFAQQLRAQQDNLIASFKQENSLNSKTLSAQYITNKRVDWIYAVRNTMSDYIAAVLFIVQKYNDGKSVAPAEDLQALNSLHARLRLYFNFTGPIDGTILQLALHIVSQINSGNITNAFLDDIESLTGHTQIYLKLEWERVKLEIEGIKSPEDIESNMAERAHEYYKLYNRSIESELRLLCPYQKHESK